MNKILARKIEPYEMCIFIGLLILLYLFCARVWNLGITNSDDASWYLASINNQWSVISDWANNQGRLFAYVVGPLMYITLRYQGTFIGEILRMGPFIIFFVLFYIVISIYFGKKIALFSALLNLALFAMRWDGNILTNYPTFSWFIGSIFLLSIWIGNFYSRSKQNKYLYISLGLFFLSLFIHEGVTLLFILLFHLSIFGNFIKEIDCNIAIKKYFQNNFSWKFSIYAVITTLLYFVLYIMFRYHFPSKYAGNHLGDFSLMKIIPVIFSFGTTGNVISDLFQPYQVNFYNNVNNTGQPIIYNLVSYMNNFVNQPTAFVNTLLVFVLTIVIFIFLKDNQQQKVNYFLNYFIGIIIAAFIAFVPHIPVAMTEKYQNSYYDFGIHSHVYTTLSHFGVTFGIAICIFIIVQYISKKPLLLKMFILLIAIVISTLSFAGYRMNDAIVNDIKTESYRWHIVDATMKIVSTNAWDISAIYSPRLFSGSWYTMLGEEYWSEYTYGLYKQYIDFENQLIMDGDIRDEVVYMDYFVSDSTPELMVLIYPISISVDGSIHYADQVVIYLENYEPSDIARYIVSYEDLSGITHVLPFFQMEKMEELDSVFQLQNIEAAPTSFYVYQQNYPTKLLVQCGSSIWPGITMFFGTNLLNDLHACIEETYIDTGWNIKEVHGIWSSDENATLKLPTYGLSDEDVLLTIELGTFSGLGFVDIPQDLEIIVNNTTYYSNDGHTNDKTGLQKLEILIPKEEIILGEPLEMIFHVSPIIKPSQEGISTDIRDLGVYLRSINVELNSEID